MQILKKKFAFQLYPQSLSVPIGLILCITESYCIADDMFNILHEAWTYRRMTVI